MPDSPYTTGLSAQEAFIRQLQQSEPKRVAGALYRGMERVMGVAKSPEYCPRDTSVLVNSGYVQLPTVTPTEISASMGFGGPAKPYAAEQHENLQLRHAQGQAKFLERPIQRAATTFMSDLAADLRASSPA